MIANTSTDTPRPKLLVDSDGRPREECGVVGVVGNSRAGTMTVLALHALQHRGQETCGMVVYDSNKDDAPPAMRHRRGMVARAFGRPDKLSSMQGDVAVGHVRYATRGRKSDPESIQPFHLNSRAGKFALAHNGQLTNTRTLRERAFESGYSFRSSSDSEVAVAMIAQSGESNLLDAILDGVSSVRGAFAFVIATGSELVGIRDRIGIRPLVLGKLPDDGYVLASESCALDILEARLIRDIAPGEMVVIDSEGYRTYATLNDANPTPRTCIFEYVYFARPDSVVDGRSVYQGRYNMGIELARQERLRHSDALPGDLVISVPDSGTPSAMGFAKGLGLDYQMGIIRNHYIGRSFIEPNQGSRKNSLRIKHSPNVAIIRDKRIYVIDDSLVRGNTSRNIIGMLRAAGAREIHFRISCPQVLHSCAYGIDIPNQKELLSVKFGGCLASIQHDLGLDSLGFLELDGLYRALGEPNGRDSGNPKFTDHYFTGDYPIPREDQQTEDQQLALPLEVIL